MSAALATAPAQEATESPFAWLQIGQTCFRFTTPAEMSERYRAAIDAAETGARDTPRAMILNANFGVVGEISYNGRVWHRPGGRDWMPGDEPVFDPCTPPPEPAAFEWGRGKLLGGGAYRPLSGPGLSASNHKPGCKRVHKHFEAHAAFDAFEPDMVIFINGWGRTERECMDAFEARYRELQPRLSTAGRPVSFIRKAN